MVIKCHRISIWMITREGERVIFTILLVSTLSLELQEL